MDSHVKSWEYSANIGYYNFTEIPWSHWCTQPLPPIWGLPSYLVSVKPASPVPLALVLTQKGKRFPFSIRDTHGRQSPNLQNFSAGTDFRNHLVFLICLFGKKVKWIIHELTVTENGFVPSSAVTIPLPTTQTCIMDYQPKVSQDLYCSLTMPMSLPVLWIQILLELEKSTSQCSGGYLQLPSFPSPVWIISFLLPF